MSLYAFTVHCPGTVDKSILPKLTGTGQLLKWKESVVYLGRRISEDCNTALTVKHRICYAESVVEQLNKRVFRRRTVPARLKGKFLNSAVFTSLLYGLELCSCDARDKRRLDGFLIRLAKRVLHLKYDFHLSYDEAERRLGVQRPSITLSRNHLRWIGHMLRSEDTVLREVINYIPENGRRSCRRPRLRYFDTLKADLVERNAINSNIKLSGNDLQKIMQQIAPAGEE